VLLKLADNKDADYAVAEAVDRNFDKLPTNVQNLLSITITLCSGDRVLLPLLLPVIAAVVVIVVV
jgi:hypothetical protein